MAASSGVLDTIPLPSGVRDGWSSARLGDVCDYVRDGDWIETKDQGGDAYRLLQISNIGVGDFRETGNFRWISEDTFQRLGCTAIERGDVLVARMPDPTGRAWFVDNLPWRAVTAVDVAIVRTKASQLDPRFLSYFLNSPVCLATVNGLTTGTTRMRIRRADIERLEVPLPPLPEQRRIAHVLGTLDDKVELNLRMNETLEEMARALFKSCFVDFDPVRAKADGRDPGIPPHLADLFPGRLVDSELGEIPEGWEITRLDGMAVIQGGRQLPGKECRPIGAFPVFGANGIMGYADRTTHEGFVIAFGRVGAYCGSIRWTSSGAWINNNASSVVPTRWSEFVLQVMLAAEFEGLRTGSAQPFIPNSSLASLPFVRPRDDALDAFCRMVRPLRGKGQELLRESCTLAAVRDALLPRLVTGELRSRTSEHQEAASTS